MTGEARTERALLESDAVRAAILSSALDAIISMDPEGRIVEFSPAAERMFGFRRADLLGKPLADHIIPHSLRDAHRGGLAHYLATGSGPVLNRRIEITALRADGVEFPVELAITPFTNRGGAGPRLRAVLHDESVRQRNGTRSRHGLRDREAVRRPCRGGE